MCPNPALTLLLKNLSMLSIETDFRPGLFERRIVKQTKEDIKQRLQGYDLGFLRIVLKRKPGSGFSLKFLGPDECVDKAKGLLGIY